MKKLNQICVCLLAIPCFLACSNETPQHNKKESSQQVDNVNQVNLASNDKLEFITHIIPLKVPENNRQDYDKYPPKENSMTRIEFQKGERAGLSAGDSINIPYIYDGSKWVAEKYGLPLNCSGSVYFLYPYEKDTANYKVDVNKRRLLGYKILSNQNQLQTMELNTPSSLLRIVIDKGDYSGIGLIKNVSISNVTSYVGLSLENTFVNTENQLVCEAILLSNNPTSLEVWLNPKDGHKAFLMLNLDGKDIKYDLEEELNPGAVYTKIITLHDPYNETIALKDYHIDYNYWRTAGKNDKVLPLMDIWQEFPNDMETREEYAIGISPRRDYGQDTYQYEFKLFQARFSFSGVHKFIGKYRFSLWRDDQLVELFPSKDIEIESDYYYITTMACYITAKPGLYQLVPLFQKKGDARWYRTLVINEERKKEWLYEVLPPAPRNLPLARIFKKRRTMGGNNYIETTDPLHQMEMEFVLYNPHKEAIKGEIAVFWEKQWQWDGNTAYPSEKLNTVTRHDEPFKVKVGSKSIEIPKGMNGYKGSVMATFPQREAPMAYESEQKRWYHIWGGKCFLYFKSHSSDEWKFVRVDPDAYVGVSEDRFIVNDDFEYGYNGFNVELFGWRN